MSSVAIHGVVFQTVAQRAIDNVHTQVFAVAAMLCLVALVMLPGRKRGLDWERKAYWCTVFAAAVCVFIAALPNLTAALVLAGLCVYIYTGHAYFRTQYLRMGGRVVAFRSSNELHTRPFGSGEDPYGAHVSAAKLWWLMAVASAIGTVNVLFYVIDGDNGLAAVVGVATFVAAGIIFGFGDGVHRQRVARGQRLQFGILTLISGSIFTLCYLVAYSVGLQRAASPQ